MHACETTRLDALRHRVVIAANIAVVTHTAVPAGDRRRPTRPRAHRGAVPRGRVRGGFTPKDPLLAVISIGIAESGLVSKARNWHTEFGYRSAAAEDRVKGPAARGTARTRPVHSIAAPGRSRRTHGRSTRTRRPTPRQPGQDHVLDQSPWDRLQPWDTFTSGTSQQYYDHAHDGGPHSGPLSGSSWPRSGTRDAVHTERSRARVVHHRLYGRHGSLRRLDTPGAPSARSRRELPEG